MKTTKSTKVTTKVEVTYKDVRDALYEWLKRKRVPVVRDEIMPDPAGEDDDVFFVYTYEKVTSPKKRKPGPTPEPEPAF